MEVQKGPITSRRFFLNGSGARVQAKRKENARDKGAKIGASGGVERFDIRCVPAAACVCIRELSREPSSDNNRFYGCSCGEPCDISSCTKSQHHGQLFPLHLLLFSHGEITTSFCFSQSRHSAYFFSLFSSLFPVVSLNRVSFELNHTRENSFASNHFVSK